MYNNTTWRDRVVDGQTGELIQRGTVESAKLFNNIETGISDVHVATALMMIAANMADE